MLLAAELEVIGFEPAVAPDYIISLHKAIESLY
jgi:hypothetical protein